jgi:hypothetical protein
MRDELKTLIDLYTGVRLPIHEPAIFASPQLTAYYVESLCIAHELYDENCSLQENMVDIAIFIVQGRWPEAEHIIAKDAAGSMDYATDVLGGRFELGEAAITKSLFYTVLYSMRYGGLVKLLCANIKSKFV